MTLLFTGFEPFGGDAFNPSGAIARSLDGLSLPGGLTIHARTLPVSGPAAWRRLSRVIRQLQPRWIIATGVSGRDGLCIESTAWNEADYRIPDNAGHQPRGSAILTRGPLRLETPLAHRLFIPAGAAGSASGLPVRISQDPGRYVCNYLYYRLLHLTRPPVHSAHQRSLFLHLPAIPEMSRGPGDSRFFHPLGDLRQVVLNLLTNLPGTAPVDKKEPEL